MEIRSARDGDSEGIRELFAACFDRSMSAEEWQWKYRTCPWQSMATVAVYEDKIIAHYGGIRMMFSGGGRMLTVFEPCDVMTHPGYRSRFFSRRGAMVKAAELFYQNAPMDFAFGFASERHSMLGAKLLGYTEHRYVDVLEKEAGGEASWLPLLVEVSQGWDRMRSDRCDALWESVRTGYPLSVEKNSRYLLWRYRDNPLRKYEVLLLKNRFSRRLAALMVFRKDEGLLNIMDYVFARDVKEDEIPGYFIAAARRFRAETVRLWANKQEPLHRICMDKGFRVSQGVPLVFKIFDRSLTADRLFRDYCYRMGDYDAV